MFSGTGCWPIVLVGQRTSGSVPFAREYSGIRARRGLQGEPQLQPGKGEPRHRCGPRPNAKCSALSVQMDFVGVRISRRIPVGTTVAQRYRGAFRH
ncbi:hypothetical protein BST10_20835 [Mycolicibacter algericus DSM 45454]|uniref:Uncharacterized protein n=1 Tax=Mycolicibacter algericus DSM 45454 TaxID=723879 RepID=A0ABX3RG18_MYCAL|nr:hypothetical protein BST10_20835 [Mycolicibacter algericus DSM 45454]